jgi:hypothetical protein
MRAPGVNPASDLANVQALTERVRQLEATVQAFLGGRRLTYRQRGTITAYTGGSTTASVTLTNGTVATCRYLMGYTPTVSHKVWVTFGPEGAVIDGQDSVP